MGNESLGKVSVRAHRAARNFVPLIRRGNNLSGGIRAEIFRRDGGREERSSYLCHARTARLKSRVVAIETRRQCITFRHRLRRHFLLSRLVRLLLSRQEISREQRGHNGLHYDARKTNLGKFPVGYVRCLTSRRRRDEIARAVEFIPGKFRPFRR